MSSQIVPIQFELNQYIVFHMLSKLGKNAKLHWTLISFSIHNHASMIAKTKLKGCEKRFKLMRIKLLQRTLKTVVCVFVPSSAEITINGRRNILERQITKTLPCVSRIKKSNNTKTEQKNNENMFAKKPWTSQKTGR